MILGSLVFTVGLAGYIEKACDATNKYVDNLRHVQECVIQLQNLEAERLKRELSK
jgi:hypothetical protein